MFYFSLCLLKRNSIIFPVGKAIFLSILCCGMTVCPLNDYMVTSLQGQKVHRVSGWNTLVWSPSLSVQLQRYILSMHMDLYCTVQLKSHSKKHHVCYKGRRLFLDCAVLRHLTNFTWSIVVSSEGASFSSFGELSKSTVTISNALKQASQEFQVFFNTSIFKTQHLSFTKQPQFY